MVAGGASRLASPLSTFLGLTLMKSLPSLCLHFASSLTGAGGRCLNACTCTYKHACARTHTHTSVSTQLVSSPRGEEEGGAGTWALSAAREQGVPGLTPGSAGSSKRDQALG